MGRIMSKVLPEGHTKASIPWRNYTGQGLGSRLQLQGRDWSQARL